VHPSYSSVSRPSSSVPTTTPEASAVERQKAFAQFVSPRDKLAQPVFWKVWRGDDARER
jgi:hypothetical protein